MALYRLDEGGELGGERGCAVYTRTVCTSHHDGCLVRFLLDKHELVESTTFGLNGWLTQLIHTMREGDINW